MKAWRRILACDSKRKHKAWRRILACDTKHKHKAWRRILACDTKHKHKAGRKPQDQIIKRHGEARENGRQREISSFARYRGLPLFYLAR
jgi:hypothetical protein